MGHGRAQGAELGLECSQRLVTWIVADRHPPAGRPVHRCGGGGGDGGLSAEPALGHRTVQRWNDRSQWIRSDELAHEPIIDDDTFGRVDRPALRP